MAFLALADLGYGSSWIWRTWTPLNYWAVSVLFNFLSTLINNAVTLSLS